MAEPAHISVDIIIDAPPQAVWDVVFDWPRQGEWILGTKVSVANGDGASQGSLIHAFSGIGKLGFLDTFVISVWEPATMCEVVHTGNVVQGTGTFEFIELPQGRTRFVWAEDLELPLGVVGQIGWPIVRPAFAYGVRKSLEKLAKLVTKPN
ncbi:unannotated protein [freshwater metagenome]|uniref:Unannotated protein n=1 Tax=freshwater metagenome TaxID=449393 RepID=A0A6J7ELR8_9ZZZZ|nr:SRPBCC family protein [Actinomycetota bacterium]